MAWLGRPQERLRRITERVQDSPASRPAIAALSHDRRLGGQLFAGALAFRLFAVLLPLALLAAVGMGFAATVDGDAVGTAADATGIREATVRSVAQSSKLQADARWLVVAFALLALLYAGLKFARAVHAVHSLAWSGVVERSPRPVGAAFLVLATIAALAVVLALAGRARAELSAGAWLAVDVLATVALFGIWLGVSLRLPHADAPWTALMPGAVLFALGLQVIHLGTVLLVAGQIERASETYGPLGAAFTILVWLFVVSRVIVASAMLNAALLRSRQAASGATRDDGSHEGLLGRL
jgi:uncharacterized BrkB/YihY/UPF0761 family membrane protein